MNLRADEMPTMAAEFVDTSLQAAPDADEIIVDLPNALHWSRFQQGTLGDLTYAIFPDGTGKVMAGQLRRTEVAHVTCVAGLSCTIDVVDGPRFDHPVGAGLIPAVPADPDAQSVAVFLARWMLAGTAPDRSTVMTRQLPVDPLAVRLNPGPVRAASPDTVDDDAESRGGRLGLDSQVDGHTGLAGRFAGVGGTEIGAETVNAPASPLPTVTRRAPDPAPVDIVVRPRHVADQPQVQPVARAVDDEEGWSLSDLNCSVTGTTSLAVLDGGDPKPRLSFGCGTKLTENLSFRGSLLAYVIPEQQRDFDPDYTYAFTYKISDHVNLSYSNYTARFSQDGGPFADLFDGNFRATIKLPDIPLPNDSVLPCTASVGLPNILDASLNLSCSYAITPDLRIGATAYLYAADGQGDYQPDYSYTVNYRINENWRLSYSNYSNNRWPWNRGPSPGPGFSGGSISLTHQLDF